MLRTGLRVGDAKTTSVLQGRHGFARFEVSISARNTPGSTPPSARISPQGAMISECPYVSRLFSCMPACAAANTKQPFSMARARNSVCQCASPVFRVKADGTVRNDAPASASAR